MANTRRRVERIERQLNEVVGVDADTEDHEPLTPERFAELAELALARAEAHPEDRKAQEHARSIRCLLRVLADRKAEAGNGDNSGQTSGDREAGG